MKAVSVATHMFHLVGSPDGVEHDKIIASLLQPPSAHPFKPRTSAVAGNENWNMGTNPIWSAPALRPQQKHAKTSDQSEGWSWRTDSKERRDGHIHILPVKSRIDAHRHFPWRRSNCQVTNRTMHWRSD